MRASINVSMWLLQSSGPTEGWDAFGVRSASGLPFDAHPVPSAAMAQTGTRHLISTRTVSTYRAAPSRRAPARTAPRGARWSPARRGAAGSPGVTAQRQDAPRRADQRRDGREPGDRDGTP